MHVIWKVRGFHRDQKEFFDRYLVLDTSTLPARQKHLVELCVERDRGREIVRYRDLFTESEDSESRWNGLLPGEFPRITSVEDYFEDEAGQPITVTQIVRIETGDDTAVAFPSHYRPHDIELALSDNSPLPDNPLEHIRLTAHETDALALFVRDVEELVRSPMYSNVPRYCTGPGGERVESISVDLIRSFVLIFRRLYMEEEPGNYIKACNAYVRHFLNKRLTNWILAEKKEYTRSLKATASCWALPGRDYSFSNREMIDVFLYTRFAHQPNAEQTRRFATYLTEVGSEPRFEWMFYTTICHLAMRYKSAHQILANEYRGYVKLGGTPSSLSTSPFINEGGRGEQLTNAELDAIAIKDRASQLARDLWQEAGCPEGGWELFLAEAESFLEKESTNK